MAKLNSNITVYFIQIRFMGKAKQEFKKLISEFDRGFGLETGIVVPHITLAGPFHTANERRLITAFHQLCSESPPMQFEINGFGTFPENKVLYLKLMPEKSLVDFRLRLASTLQTFCTISPYDKAEQFAFHATVKRNLSQSIFNLINDFIISQPVIRYKQKMLRLTLLKNGIILREYDFLLRKLLNRRLALNKQILKQTFIQLQANL